MTASTTTTRAPGDGADAPIAPRQIQALQAARRGAGIDDDAWRERLRSRFEVASTKALTAAQGQRLLAELRGGRADRLGGPYGARARALWISAYQLCLTDDRGDDALLAYVRRQTGYQTLAWVRDARDGRAVIEGLKAWLARDGGVDWSSGQYADPKRAVVSAIVRRLAAAGEDIGAGGLGWWTAIGAWADARVKVGPAVADWSPRDWDQVAQVAGRVLRRADKARRS